MWEEQFGQRLYELRVNQNKSARDLSLSIGQIESYINKIENSKAFPSMQVFFYICEYLNITPQEFFNEHHEYPELIYQILLNLEKMNQQQLKNILNITNDMI